MLEQNRIRFSSIISDPEAYIAEMFQLHPDAKHDKESGGIEIKNDIINSAFKYQLLEEGFFLFSFSSYSPVDAEYEFLPNPTSYFFTLVFYFTEKKTKNPLYIKMDEEFYSSNQVSMFFNGTMNAEIFIKSKQKAYGLRLDIHKKWLSKNLKINEIASDSQLAQILSNKAKAFVEINCLKYKTLVEEILLEFDAQKSFFQKLSLKAKSFQLLSDYFSEIVNLSSPKTPKYSETNLELHPALNFMEKNIYKIFSGTSYLSSICNVSESSFIKKFKDSFGISSTQYFKNLKMKEALYLLEIGGNVKEVAYKIGYKDTSAFGRSFKQFYGKSPASFVKK